MADETTTTWANLLREMKGPLVEALKWKTVLLAEIKKDTSPRRWAGKQVTIPIILAPQQGTSMITQTGTLTTPIVHDDTQAVVTSAIIAIAISFSTQVMEQAKNDDTSWATVVPLKMRMAEEAFSRVINEQFCGDGTALLASITANATSVTQTVGTTANFYQLYPNRTVDVLTRSTGVAVTGGTAAKISTTSPSAGTVTFTASVTGTTNEGIYIQGSYGNALAGFGGAVATTGTFQNINKATVQSWQGTDASPSAASDPTIAVFDKADRLALRNSGVTPKFYMADPAVIDKYTQGLTVQARWAGDEAKLASGFSGVAYRNKALIPEFDMPSSTAFGITPEDASIFTLTEGPDWDDRTGSVFQRFGTRSLPVEAWLVWMLQLGFLRCNSQVKIGNLNQAT
jgi:hypothetical protein